MLRSDDGVKEGLETCLEGGNLPRSTLDRRQDNHASRCSLAFRYPQKALDWRRRSQQERRGLRCLRGACLRCAVVRFEGIAVCSSGGEMCEISVGEEKVLSSDRCDFLPSEETGMKEYSG